jgi:hypothetical protein
VSETGGTLWNYGEYYLLNLLIRKRNEMKEEKKENRTKRCIEMLYYCTQNPMKEVKFLRNGKDEKEKIRYNPNKDDIEYTDLELKWERETTFVLRDSSLMSFIF